MLTISDCNRIIYSKPSLIHGDCTGWMSGLAPSKFQLLICMIRISVAMQSHFRDKNVGMFDGKSVLGIFRDFHSGNIHERRWFEWISLGLWI